VNTTTGVNNSPTKNMREVESTFSVADNDVAVDRWVDAASRMRMQTRGCRSCRAGWRGHTVSTNKTEILLRLQVQEDLALRVTKKMSNENNENSLI
jgi:general secretion pathway protein D